MKVRIADLEAYDFQKNGRPMIHNEDLNSLSHTAASHLSNIQTSANVFAE
jgi:hypothetical protein